MIKKSNIAQLVPACELVVKKMRASTKYCKIDIVSVELIQYKLHFTLERVFVSLNEACMQSSTLGMASIRQQIAEHVGVSTYQKHSPNVRRISLLFTGRKEEET